MEVSFRPGAASPTCAWFALCENDSDGVVEHPALGYVPTCQRCADKASVTIIPADWEMA